jgi:hypothetical protein
VHDSPAIDINPLVSELATVPPFVGDLMGAVFCIINESQRRFIEFGRMCTLSLEGTRLYQASPLRYCLRGDTLYLPKGISPEDITFSQRFSWARVRPDSLYNLNFAFAFEEPLPTGITFEFLEEVGFELGSRYVRRHREIDGKRTAVSTFCSATLVKGIRDNPEVISQLGKEHFEALCAELFVSRGFEVDLYRKTKDGGIDFLALRTNECDPILMAVQCKHPDATRASGKAAKTLPVTTIREIYGVAKANNLTGGIAITSAEYSPEAKRFAELKPDEMAVYNRSDILEWVQKYRWNDDEPA